MSEGVLYLSTFIWDASKGPFWNQPRGNNIIDSGKKRVEKKKFIISLTDKDLPFMKSMKLEMLNTWP